MKNDNIFIQHRIRDQTKEIFVKIEELKQSSNEYSVELLKLYDAFFVQALNDLMMDTSNEDFEEAGKTKHTDIPAIELAQFHLVVGDVNNIKQHYTNEGIAMPRHVEGFLKKYDDFWNESLSIKLQPLSDLRDCNTDPRGYYCTTFREEVLSSTLRLGQNKLAGWHDSEFQEIVTKIADALIDVGPQLPEM